MTGLAAMGPFAAEAGQGFALCLTVAAVSDLILLRRWRHLTGRAARPGDPRPRAGRRPVQWRALMVVSLGRLAADAVGLLLVFFLLPGEWALIGGALGLVTWRFLWVALSTRRLPRPSGLAVPGSGERGTGCVPDSMPGRHEEAVS